MGMATRPGVPQLRKQPIVLVTLLALAFAPVALACSRTNQSSAPQPSVVSAPPSAATSAAAKAQPPDDAPLAEFRMHGAADDKGKPFDVSGKVIVMGIDPKTNVMQ